MSVIFPLYMFQYLQSEMQEMLEKEKKGIHDEMEESLQVNLICSLFYKDVFYAYRIRSFYHI